MNTWKRVSFALVTDPLVLKMGGIVSAMSDPFEGQRWHRYRRTFIPV